VAIDARTIKDSVFRDALRPWAEAQGINIRTMPCAALRDALHEYTLGHFPSLNSDHYLNPCWEPIYHLTAAGHSKLDRLAVGVPYVYTDQPARFGHNRDQHCRGNVLHLPYKTTQSRADRDFHPAPFPVELAAYCISSLR
jgi:hypothetical protein